MDKQIDKPVTDTEDDFMKATTKTIHRDQFQTRSSLVRLRQTKGQLHDQDEYEQNTALRLTVFIFL